MRAQDLPAPDNPGATARAATADRRPAADLPPRGHRGDRRAAGCARPSSTTPASSISTTSYEVSFKVETHNHPSAIEPFGGANTGVGGVIRDVLGVSARPIAATDVLCFGPQDADPDNLPEGVLHPRRIRSGVVAGVQDYGNKIGMPTVNGAICTTPATPPTRWSFAAAWASRPRAAIRAAPQPGDRVIVLGGRTGRDGLARRHLLLDDHGRADRRGLGRLGADRRPDHREGPDRGDRARARPQALPRHHRLRRRRSLLRGGRDGQPPSASTWSCARCGSNTRAWRRGRSGSRKRRNAWCWRCPADKLDGAAERYATRLRRRS